MRIFVTGVSGWIGSALVPELINAGHQVLGLVRSDSTADDLAAAGAEAVHGTVDDLDVLGSTAAASDGVIHLAFKNDMAFAGNLQGAAEADRRAVDTFGDALAGTGRPLVIASNLLGLAPGRVATERDRAAIDGSPGAMRQATARAALALASRGVRSSVVRLAPTCHGEGDNGFIAMLISIARSRRVSGHIGDGANRWPAVHRLDAARLFRLAVEKAPAGSVLHGIAEEGVPIRDIAEVISRHLDVPVASVAPEAAAEHFDSLGALLSFDAPTSNTLTRELLDWHPTHPGLLEDLDTGHYFRTLATTA
ncbi:SDR family oxidoreductase [Streptomyces sp. ME19-01-6]|uniref:SDR family oxidoreductase n=1 Tax=Streptomyces sp. ME19-01-6 TaxID=3028686 RepID=UPI0029B57F4C|nr:SDR family oxidoreductase [Streptomyces sp. ME19-01-6]MDX3226695.1 SDR family oxidoreductase [Streptomyces sp. ME19-01-6]